MRMDTDPPPPRSARKRTASDFSPPATASTPAPNLNDNGPRILRRHHHRRRNVAATIWGPDIPLTSRPHKPARPAPPQPFNVYKSLLRHPNLFFQLCIRLPYPSIIALYAIDKEFHYRLNKYSVSVIHDYARYWAPIASRVFSWVLYPELCISDPMLRPMDGREWLARDVPGFRWVGMVLARQKVVRGILGQLAVEGHRVPKGVEETLCKFWVVMEMHSTLVRTAFLQDREIWTDADIRNFHLFLVKLDMRFSDPILGSGWCAFSHALLTQRSLRPLWAVLTGKVVLDYDRLTNLVVRTYPADDMDTDTMPWLDDEVDNEVPERLWGIQMKEGWDPNGGRMESCVDMVIAEGVRRELHVQKHLLNFVRFGHEKDMRVARKWRGHKAKVVEMPAPLSRSQVGKVVEMIEGRFGFIEAESGSGIGMEDGIGSESGSGGGNDGGSDEDSEGDDAMDESA